MTTIISLIIPVYNTEKYLPACLDSLYNQTMQDVEFLCINDGSTDSSGEILSQYAKKDPRFRVFNQKNAGSGSARNKGLSEARGKYIMFCDSDDWYEPNMCERMYRTIEEQNVDFVMCNTFIEQADKRILNIDLTYFFPSKTGRFHFNIHLCKTLNILLWNKIFRKDLIDQYKISFPDGMRGTDDIPFTLSYFFVVKSVYFLDEKLYHYVQRTESFMDGWLKIGRYKIFLVYLQILNFLYQFLVQANLLKSKDSLFCQFYLHFIKKCWYCWQCVPSSKYNEAINLIRTDVSQFQIKSWPLFQPRQFYKALMAEDHIRLLKILMNTRSKYTLLLRSVKYTLLEKITFGNKRKKCRRKKFRVLYELRRLKRIRMIMNEENQK